MAEKDSKLQALPAIDMDLSNQIRESVEKGRSQAVIARAAGISDSALSQYLAGSYKGNIKTVENKLQLVLQLEEERALSDESFIETSISKKILTALRYSHVNGEIVIVYGEAGLGKTMTCEKYAQENNAIYIECPGSSNTIRAIYTVIANKIGARDCRTCLEMEMAIVEKLEGSGRLMIIDEANLLSQSALDSLRIMQGRAKIGLALVGNEVVFSRMYGAGRAEFAQLFNRISMRVDLTSPTPGDCEKISQSITGKNNSQIERWAKKKGSTLMALRGEVKVLRLAKTMAKGEGEEISMVHVHRADRMINLFVIE